MLNIYLYLLAVVGAFVCLFLIRIAYITVELLLHKRNVYNKLGDKTETVSEALIE